MKPRLNPAPLTAEDQQIFSWLNIRRVVLWGWHQEGSHAFASRGDARDAAIMLMAAANRPFPCIYLQVAMRANKREAHMLVRGAPLR